MNGESLLWWLVIPGALLVGFGLLYGLSVLIGESNKADRAQELASIYSHRQWNRRNERMDVLNLIGRPECPDGTFSPLQVHLWQKYKELEKENQVLTDGEINHLVSTQTVIDERTQYELDHGINPY